jgi:hypothetical protein
MRLRGCENRVCHIIARASNIMLTTAVPQLCVTEEKTDWSKALANDAEVTPADGGWRVLLAWVAQWPAAAGSLGSATVKTLAFA